MTLDPDTIVLWRLGPFALNATIAWSWAIIAVAVALSIWATRSLGQRPETRRTRVLFALIDALRKQIREISRRDPDPLLPFIATLFLFVLACNLVAVVPGVRPPTGSLSTTTALALAVFVAVPLFGIADTGPRAYLRRYLEPTPLMLPFNLIGDLSRTVALAVRLYGNVMSGSVIGAILLTLVPLFVPVVMQLLGLVTGVVQAAIFAVLATVYISAAREARRPSAPSSQANQASQPPGHP